MVSEWSSDCTRLWCSTFSVDIYWAKQYAMRVMLVHSSVPSHRITAVPVSTAGLTKCKSLVLLQAVPEKSNMLVIASIAICSEVSSTPCIVSLWTDSSCPSSVILVAECMHRSVKLALVGNWRLKTQFSPITAEYDITYDSQYKQNKSSKKRTYRVGVTMRMTYTLYKYWKYKEEFGQKFNKWQNIKKIFKNYRLLFVTIIKLISGVKLYVYSSALNEKLSYHRRKVQLTSSVEILSTDAQLPKNSHFKRLAIGSWPSRSLKVIGNGIIR